MEPLRKNITLSEISKTSNQVQKKNKFPTCKMPMSKLPPCTPWKPPEHGLLQSKGVSKGEASTGPASWDPDTGEEKQGEFSGWGATRASTAAVGPTGQPGVGAGDSGPPEGGPRAGEEREER